VTNAIGNTVSVIDGTTSTLTSNISVGSYPAGIGVNSSTNRIYVANADSDMVSVIDGTTNTVISTISVESYPYGVGVNFSTNRIYVSNHNSNSVSVIDGATNTAISTISVGNGPIGVEVNSSTNRIYVANKFSNTVSVIEDSPATSITPTPTSPTQTPTPVASPTPQPSQTVLPTLPPLPTATPSQTPNPGGSGVVYGFVYNADEESLKNVTVSITGGNFSDSATTDEDGYYEFSGLAEGDYTLTFEKEGYQSYTEDISLTEGETLDMGTIIMETAEKGMIYGYVTNIKGNSIEYVRLKLKGIGTKTTKQASSDADGYFEFTDLEADTYIITAKRSGFKPVNQRIKLEDGEVTDIEIVMKKSSRRIAFVKNQ
jgi:YVTN family beta-propeller protein